MSSTRPRRTYRRLERGSVEIKASGPFTPQPVEGRVGKLVVRVMSAYASWRRRHLTPEKLERARREQEIAARQLGGIDFPDR